MTWDGMLPAGITCKNCDAELGTRNPAERYAGTYTGLCYKCQNQGPFIIARYNMDGAIEISYAPSSPSWRRDREDYVAYKDCENCKGTGYKWSTRTPPSAGSYRSYCKLCFNKFYRNPIRSAWDQGWRWRMEKVSHYCQEKYEEELLDHFGYPVSRQLLESCEWVKEEAAPLSEKWLAEYRYRGGLINKHLARMYPEYVTDKVDVEPFTEFIERRNKHELSMGKEHKD